MYSMVHWRLIREMMQILLTPLREGANHVSLVFQGQIPSSHLPFENVVLPSFLKSRYLSSQSLQLIVLEGECQK